MSLEVLNELAREYNMEERKSVKKTKINLQKVKSEMNAISGKKGKETYKRKREEIEERQFDWPSPSQSQSQSQGENILFIDSQSVIDSQFQSSEMTSVMIKTGPVSSFYPIFRVQFPLYLWFCACTIN